MKRPGKKSLLLIGTCLIAAAIGPISYVASGSPFYLIALLVQGTHTDPSLSATNEATLFDDVDGEGDADAGDTIEYTVMLSNTGGGDALGVVYENLLDLNTTLVPGSLNVSPLAVDDAYKVNEGDVLVVDGAPNATLLDNDREFLGDTFSLTAFTTTTTPQGITVNVAADGTFTYTPLSSFGGIDSFTYTIEDPAGLTGTGTANIDVNQLPDAENDDVMTNEDTVLMGNVFADNGHGIDSDPDGDMIFVSKVNGSSTDVGVQITLASGALLTVNANGTFSYDPNGKFESLAVGETDTDSFTYTLSDPDAAEDTATVTITITGVNDPPVITVGGSDSAAETLTETNAGLSVSDTLSVEDLDTSDTVDASVVSVSVTGDDDGIGNAALLAMMSVGANPVIDGASTTGTITWMFNSGAEAFDHLAAGETLVLAYTLRATDAPTGATDDQMVTVTITGTNDAPIITGGATAAVDAAENQTGVTNVDSTDPDGETENGGGLTYSLTMAAGGADNAFFTLNSATGLLTFTSAPDFETKADAGANNVYDVQVTVTDAGGLTDVQDITVTVTDVMGMLSAAAGTEAFTYTPGVRLSESKLNCIVDAAIERWSAAGISAEERVRLEAGFVISIVDRPGLFLGSATVNELAIDRDGGGYGWYVDPTPGDDEEFELSEDGAELRAKAGSSAEGRMDLLTVVLHELGHMLGRPHEDGAGLMAEALPTGVRRLPGAPRGRDPDPPDRWRTDAHQAGIEPVIGQGGVQ